MDKLKYIKATGLSSTLLGAFADDPYFAVTGMEGKSYFEEGKQFERMIEDRCTGSNLFSEKYFVGDDVKIPDDFINIVKSKRPIWEFITVTQKNELNKTKENLHHWIGKTIEANPDYKDKTRLFPVNKSSYDQMNETIDRMMEIEIDLFDDFSPKLKDLINEETFWQLPVYWSYGGIEKKALYDMVCFFVYRGMNFMLALDIKFLANMAGLKSFYRNTRSKYVIQNMHYSQGLHYIEAFRDYEKYNQMPLVVGTKTEPYFVGAHMVSDQSIEYCENDYELLCIECDKWIKNGKPVTKIKKTQKHRIWSA